MTYESDANALRRTQQMRARFKETIDHLRRDIAGVEEPQCRAMFETAAEVLEGLRQTFEHYEQKNEQAWR